MGGTSPTPPQAVETVPERLRPLQSGLFSSLASMALPGDISNLLGETLRGSFLPGANQGPSLSGLFASWEPEEARTADLARRNFASAAQRAGALSGTDYLRGSADLESQIASQAAARRQSAAMQVREQERGRQQQAISQAFAPFQQIIQMLLGSSQVAAGQPGQPSPFGSLLSGIAELLPVL